MKIRNFAFFGVMASILAISGANAVETTRQLATKAYVDNKAADANYRSNANYANNTIGKAIQDLASSTESSLAALDADLDATANSVVTGVTQVDGVITSVDSSQVSEAMLDSSLGAKVDSYDTHIADTSIHVTPEDKATWNAKQNALTFDSTPTAESTNPVTSGGVAAAIAAAQQAAGTITEATRSADTDEVVTSVTTENGSVKSVGSAKVSQSMLDTTLGNKVTGYDTHVGDSTIHVTTTDKTNWNAKQDSADRVQDMTLVTTAADKAAKYPSVAAVEAAVSSANSTALDALDATDVTVSGQPIVSVGQTNGVVHAAAGTITNAGVATGANIEYAKMDAGIVNLDDQTATCSTTNPCMLTYVGNNTYKWTNMIETTDETLTAVQGE